MTASLHFHALPADELDAVRTAGVDQFGNALEVFTSTEATGTPLRCCLQEAAVGDRVALLAWRPATQPGAYAEVGPVFIHAAPCAGYPSPAAYPPGFRPRQQLLRSYDSTGRQVDNRLVEGVAAEPVLEKLLARPDVAYVHSRNPLPGCYMFAVTRADAPGCR